MSFKPMYDLESLSEAQRQEYYLSACEYFHVPPELNLLAFIWLDSNDGKRNLVLYAKKGATDIMREYHGISTTKVTKDSGPGYVSWVVEGVNAQGRAEMAVGSASIEGLKGQALSNAVMIAHTRGMRRLTLQFVGGGLLDESELPSTVSNIVLSGASLASLSTQPMPIQPSVAPNTEPGKDVTQEFAGTAYLCESISEPSNRKKGYGPPSLDAQNPPKEGVSLHEAACTPEPEPVKKRRGPGRRKSEIVIDCPASEDFGAPYLGPEVPLDAIAEHTKQSISIAEIAKASLPQMNIPTAESAQQALTTVAITMPKTVIPEPMQERIQTTVFPSDNLNQPIPDASKPFTPEQLAASETQADPDMPSKAEKAAWRARLFVFTNDVLPKGGMRKEDGIIWKIRKYVQQMFPDLPVKNGNVELNNKQWTKLMNDLDETLKHQGPTGLVQYLEAVAAKA